jgi:hypothetical protein
MAKEKGFHESPQSMASAGCWRRSGSRRRRYDDHDRRSADHCDVARRVVVCEFGWLWFYLLSLSLSLYVK